MRLELQLGLRRRSRRQEDRKKFRLAVESIVCNLIAVRWLTGDSNAALAVPRASKAMWNSSRYQSPVYGRHFLDALDLLSGFIPGSLIVEGPRGYRFQNGDTRQSCILATDEFNKRFPTSHFDLGAIERAEESEVLVLKSPKGPAGRSEAIDYRDTALTRRRRKQVQRINSVLRVAPLRISDDALPLVLSDDGQPVDLSHRALRRVFNNGDWIHGGRLFGGFWENMRRADRFNYLRICTAANPDGEAIANIDFGQLFPALAYLRTDREPPEQDLYDISGEGSHRDGWKKLFNALLFATKPMMRWPRETSSLFPKGTKLRVAIEMIRQAHAPISDLLDGTGVGFKLMLLESEILLTALGLLATTGITALPLHDSVIVAASDAEAAKGIMGQAFTALTGSARAKLGIYYA